MTTRTVAFHPRNPLSRSLLNATRGETVVYIYIYTRASGVISWRAREPKGDYSGVSENPNEKLLCHRRWCLPLAHVTPQPPPPPLRRRTWKRSQARSTCVYSCTLLPSRWQAHGERYRLSRRHASRAGADISAPADGLCGVDTRRRYCAR